MRGNTMEEVYEYLTYNRDIEFNYRDKPYIIQPEYSDDKKWLVIWTAYNNDKNTCILKEEISSKGDVEKEVIDKVLNAKCFDGKSFIEIEKDITITYIW